MILKNWFSAGENCINILWSISLSELFIRLTEKRIAITIERNRIINFSFFTTKAIQEILMELIIIKRIDTRKNVLLIKERSWLFLRKAVNEAKIINTTIVLK